MPDRLRMLLAQADALLATGDWANASQRYRDALAMRPECADAWFNLGFALRRLGCFNEAVGAYTQALRAGVSQPEEAYLNRAALYSDHLRDEPAAMSDLRAALRVAPGNGPALLNLGNLHEERGEREAAIACYRQLLDAPAAADQTFAARALARMAQLAPPTGPYDGLFAQLHGRATGTVPLADDVRADLFFALGRAYDGIGAPAQAFAAFAQGKQCAHSRHPGYDPVKASRLTDALIDTSPAPASNQGPTLKPAPLFICGMFRSGSTLVEQVLAMHPLVVAGGELELLPRLVAGPLAPFPGSLRDLDDMRLHTLSSAYVEAMARAIPDIAEHTRYATDKRPDNFRLIGLIKRLFPGARIIHTVRDPRDNGLAIFMQHLNPRVFPYAASLTDIGHHFGEYRRLMAHWKTLYPDDIHDFDYDAFVAAPEPAVRALLAFLDLPWHARCLDFHTLGNTVRTASYWQVRRPLYSEASGRWRRYHDQLGPLITTLQAQGVSLGRRDGPH